MSLRNGPGMWLKKNDPRKLTLILHNFMDASDLDPLRVRPDADGVIRLELRNEALETHFINHVEVVAVRHAEGTRVVPDQRGRPVAVSVYRLISRMEVRAPIT